MGLSLINGASKAICKYLGPLFSLYTKISEDRL